MTWLHTFRGQLPQDRTELYANAVDLLLRRWQGRVGEEEGILERLEIPGLKMSDLEAGLYDVGYRAHSKGVEDDTRDGTATADVDEGDLRKWLAPYLGDDWNKAGVFVDYIRNRAGLLIRHKRDAYTFPHRTFQEFMAASHLVGGMQDYPGQAARLVREDLARWQQVFVLAAGHAARTHRLFQAISAVNVLCSDEVRNVKQPDATVYRRAQLAGESLLEIGLIGVQRETAGQVVLRRVQDWLRIAMRADQILPPHRRAEAGNILSQLGDPRFREDAWYLPDDSQLGFVKIPKGPFLMGEGDDQHELNLPTYYIARYPVTVAQFRSFVESSGYEPHDWYSLRNLDNHPVVLVTWYAALAYCKWLTKTLCDWAEVPEPLATLLRKKDWVVTLPSEAEWEKAARGNDGSICPRCRKSNLNHVKYYRDTDIGTKTSAVGCFPNDKSPYGVEELNGNVWEWTRSLWGRELMDPQFEYPYDPSDGRENLEAGDDTLRVLRGGAFNFNSKIGRCTARYKYSPSNLGRSEGFRIVISRVKHWHCTD
jgi:formylglycine-generating enzyme required for sulfatase activity